jgi:hypothetical protein
MVWPLNYLISLYTLTLLFTKNIQEEKLYPLTDLEITGKLFVQGLKEIFSKSLSISFSDNLPLNSIPMTQDRYNQSFISSPTYNQKSKLEVKSHGTKNMSLNKT